MTNAPDSTKPQDRAATIGGILGGAVLATAISLGVRLGLYHALRDAGPLTSEQFAERSGFHERWIREWLRAQAAAGILDYNGDGRFEFPSESAALLADPTSLSSMESIFQGIPELYALMPKVEQAFRTGLGFNVDTRGEQASGIIAVLEGAFGNWHRQVLVQGALPALDGVVEKLTAGALAADVGCGSGIALLEMAKAFPHSVFHGYDNSTAVLSAASENLAAAGVDNASFYNMDEEALPESERYDFVMTFDCLHDMPHPDQMASTIRTAMKPDGVWFIADMNGEPTFEDNLRDNSMAARQYSRSIFDCLASSMCEPDSVGYGTLGLPEPAMKQLAEDAGFTRFRRVRPDIAGFAMGVTPALFEARP